MKVMQNEGKMKVKMKVKRGPGPGPVIRDTPLDPCASRVHSFGNKHSTSLARGHPKNCEIFRLMFRDLPRSQWDCDSSPRRLALHQLLYERYGMIMEASTILGTRGDYVLESRKIIRGDLN